MGVMGARRLLLGVLVSVCALGCVFGAGAGSARAAAGSFQFGPLGEEAGQINGQASGLAVDRESGDIYVSDSHSQRVDEFGQSGSFLRAWGWGVIPPTRANEFQVCTSATGCMRGLEEPGAGEFSSDNAYGIAVDNAPPNASHDVYVVDAGYHRVQKFDSEGKFLLMFGGHVNRTTSGDVCVAGEACGLGTEGVGDGEFSWSFNRAIIAVGPGGKVYVGDKARVQVFEPSGAWKENISLSALSSEGKVTALAVNAAGDVFVKDEGVPGVREFEPGGIEMAAKFDEGSELVESIALDGSGDVFISENKASEGEPCKCDFLEYAPSGQQLENFGGSTLMSIASGMVLDEALGELLVYGTDAQIGNTEYGHYGVWAFPLPSPGPLIEPGSAKGTPELRGAAALEASVNPEGNATEVTFEYVDDAAFRASGFANAVSTAPVSLSESGFSDEHVEVHLPARTLVPGVVYHWRAVAHNSQGTNRGADESFEEIPPAYVEGPWATSVTATSVTLSARIDPLGASTSYRLEYGTSNSYGHVFAGNVGEGTSFAQIDRHVQGLQPNTTYHYRVVTESEVGTVEGSDRMFTTQPASGELFLPDDRAWELVSPPDKGGALIEDIQRAQAASDGSGIVYAASEPIGEGIVGHVGNNAESIAGATVLSRSGAGGWRTRDISPTQTLPPEGMSDLGLTEGAEIFTAFTPTLSLGVLEPQGLNALQSKEATEQTLYLRNNASETYEPLVTPTNVPPGTKWDPVGSNQDMNFQAATPDLGHVLFSDWAALTPEALPGNASAKNLYEWGGGQLQLVNILPDGKPAPGAAFGTGEEGRGEAPNPWAMSGDGRWVVFRYGQIGSGGPWYVRDMVEHKTTQFSGAGHARFETMSRDGARLFYLASENTSVVQAQQGDLYLFDPTSGAATDLTANHLGGASAEVQNMVMGIGEDGSYVYFVAKGVLASGATRGQDNLYVMHYGGSEWQTTFIATLSGEDEKDWHNPAPQGSVIKNITSRVTANGRFLTFMSNRSLTGYDNHDARSGQPDEEVYLYDASANRLVCASCNPSGARPVGVLDRSVGNQQQLLMDQSGAWAEQGGHWLAGVIAPEWHTVWEHAIYSPRYLSESGRLFFNSSDALVPQDTNGLSDVYEYEPIGVGSCTSTSAAFDVRSGGCVSLVSSGQSLAESTFLDASETGDDVFFVTAAKLVGEDYDTANDVYDAHVCTTARPCRTEPVLPPACSSGDSCKAAPSPQPEIFGPAPSATFNGAGNVLASLSKSVAPRSLTRAQKLARALRACRKGDRKRRVVCERQARKHYPAQQSRKAKATRKGNR
jgi:hypothetical protein